MADQLKAGPSHRHGEGWLRKLVPAVAISGVVVGILIEIESLQFAFPPIRYLPYVFILLAGFFGALRSTMGSAAIGGGLGGFFVSLAGGLAFVIAGEVPAGEGWKSLVAGLITLTTAGIVIGTMGGLLALTVRKLRNGQSPETRSPTRS